MLDDNVAETPDDEVGTKTFIIQPWKFHNFTSEMKVTVTKSLLKEIHEKGPYAVADRLLSTINK